MPRIDPLQLLTCLSILLTPAGGIKSKEEVNRLANLMTKFSKKLVSKCIYIQILKTTDSELLGMFVAAGGWSLINVWLSNAIVAKNWALIQELLELLLLCPVDVERLKTNSCPKLVKGLSKEGCSENVRFLASKLVEQWLSIVKGETVKAAEQYAVQEVVKPVATVIAAEMTVPEVSSAVSEEGKVTVVQKAPIALDNSVGSEQICVNNVPIEVLSVSLESVVETFSIKTRSSIIKKKVEPENDDEEEEEVGDVDTWNGPVEQLPVYTFTIRDGKQVFANVYSEDTNKKLSDEMSELPYDSIKSVVVNQDGSVDVTETVVKDVAPVVIEEPEVNVKQNGKLEKPDSSSSETLKVKDPSKKSKEMQSKNIDKKVETEISKYKSNDKEVAKDKIKKKSQEKEEEKVKGKLEEKIKNKELVKDNKKSPELSTKEALQAEKDIATLAQLIPPLIVKLGKIPKKTKTKETAEKGDMKAAAVSGVKKSPDAAENIPLKNNRGSISTDIRNKNGSHPKTVKKFNSKFRSTGLEEEIKPPPTRAQKKTVAIPPLKRSPPPQKTGSIEKKLKQLVEVLPEDNNKPGKAGIILIPPRPKPAFLLERDMFMDALTAASKREPRKRKLISSIKNSTESKKDLGDKKETIPLCSSSDTDEVKSAPSGWPTLKFYQDTMEAEEEKETERESEIEIERKEEEEEEERSSTPAGDCRDEEERGDPGASDEEKGKLLQEDSNKEKTESSLKGVLVYHRSRKEPKKLVCWKPEKDLEMIRYFELDESERVNVSKTFTDMKRNERLSEREALLARKLPDDDTMEEDSAWRDLIPIDCPPLMAEPGKDSREKDVQYAREKVVPEAIYFNKLMIPDSPGEPNLEIQAVVDPVVIPLDDVSGNADCITDLSNFPWPKPKPLSTPQSAPPQYRLPQQTQPHAVSSSSHVMVSTSQYLFSNQQGVPGALPNSTGMMMPGMEGAAGAWRTGDGKVLQMNSMSASVDMYTQGAMGAMGMNMGMNVNIMMPAMVMDMYGNMAGGVNYNVMGGGEKMLGGPFPPQNFPMGGTPNTFFPNNRGHGPGPMRGRGRRQQFNNQQGGGPWRGGRGGRGRGWRAVCKHFLNGYCRSEEKCHFLHPGVNGPPQY